MSILSHVTCAQLITSDGAASDLNWTSAAIVESGSDFINVRFTAKEGDFHWVIYDDLAGAYQYFVNRALPVLGEFRTLWRLDNATFPRGRTNVKDDILPPLSEYAASTNVQDETWQKPDGSFLTKYDWSAFIREVDYYGVYGDQFGSWYINPGKDYYNGDHLKQELMVRRKNMTTERDSNNLQVHRESKTGDAVQLNMIHGTHYQAVSRDIFADGKTWGPWLWYLNDGSKDDAAHRAKQEEREWPYKWLKDVAYQSRGSVDGRLVLSDGRPASGAAVFLGDNKSSLSTLDQGRGYYYTTYADKNGKFRIDKVRTGTYGLQAWASSGKLVDVSTTFVQNDIVVQKDTKTKLPTAMWKVSDRRYYVFQLGDFSRTTDGFRLSGPPYYEHGRISKCPANFTYTVGKSKPADWCFGQVALGTQSIVFPVEAIPLEATGAKLIVSLAGFSSGSSAQVLLNTEKIGDISSDSASLPNSQDTYRGATRAGEWRLLEYAVPEDLLRKGLNQLDFTVTTSTQWRGWLWDAIILEWVV